MVCTTNTKMATALLASSPYYAGVTVASPTPAYKYYVSTQPLYLCHKYNHNNDRQQQYRHHHSYTNSANWFVIPTDLTRMHNAAH